MGVEFLLFSEESVAYADGRKMLVKFHFLNLTDMRDPMVLQDLDRPNIEISSIWALMPSLSPKPHPGLPQSVPQENMKEGKGSRFAKFISDTDIFKSSTGDSKPGKLPLQNIRSKL